MVIRIDRGTDTRMQFSRKSFSNLQALEQGDWDGNSTSELQGGGPLGRDVKPGSAVSMDSDAGKRGQRWVVQSFGEDGVKVGDWWISRVNG